jgi:CRP-like cAMP-binding protein
MKAQTNLQKRLALRQRAKQERALKKCKSFQHVSTEAQDQIVDAMTFQTMETDTVLCQQNSVADKMYLLMSGHCSVQVDGVHVADLYELDVFGENALFSTTNNSTRNRPLLRSATVIAREDVDVLVLSRNALKTLLHSRVLDRQTMMALKTVAEDRRQQNALLKQAMHLDVLRECSLFASLTKAKRETVVEAMALQVFEKDQVLCKQGETAEAMYLVMSGKCAVVVGGQTVGTLEKLDVFGESALFGQARNATVRAVTERVKVLMLLQKDLVMLDPACVAGIKALAKKRKEGNDGRVGKREEQRDNTL